MSSNKKPQPYTDKFEIALPGLLNSARLTISGRRLLLIENHSGLLRYEDELIEVDCGSMKTVVRGTELQLQAMDSTALMIFGRILSVEFE